MPATPGSGRERHRLWRGQTRPQPAAGQASCGGAPRTRPLPPCSREHQQQPARRNAEAVRSRDRSRRRHPQRLREEYRDAGLIRRCAAATSSQIGRSAAETACSEPTQTSRGGAQGQVRSATGTAACGGAWGAAVMAGVPCAGRPPTPQSARAVRGGARATWERRDGAACGDGMRGHHHHRAEQPSTGGLGLRHGAAPGRAVRPTLPQQRVAASKLVPVACRRSKYAGACGGRERAAARSRPRLPCRNQPQTRHQRPSCPSRPSRILLPAPPQSRTPARPRRAVPRPNPQPAASAMGWR